MSSYMDVDLSGVHEPEPVPDNTECTVQIKKVYPDPNETWLRILLSIEDHDQTKLFSEFVSFPKDSDDQTVASAKKLNIKRFMEAFTISEEEWNPQAFEAWEGKTARAILGLKQDAKYGDQNKVNRYIYE